MPAPEIRYLTEQEMNAMLTADTPCYLATIANGGFPRVTPIWFVWDGHAFVMTSFETKRHVGDLQRNAKAAVCIELEQRVSGIDRPNWQIRATGTVTLSRDSSGVWTRRISEKYMIGDGAQDKVMARASTGSERYAIRLVPIRISGLASSESRYPGS